MTKSEIQKEQKEIAERVFAINDSPRPWNNAQEHYIIIAAFRLAQLAIMGED